MDAGGCNIVSAANCAGDEVRFFSELDDLPTKLLTLGLTKAYIILAALHGILAAVWRLNKVFRYQRAIPE